MSTSECQTDTRISTAECQVVSGKSTDECQSTECLLMSVEDRNVY